MCETDVYCLVLQLVKECNEGARQMNNIEEVNQIDRMLDFKHIKVSHESLKTGLCNPIQVMHDSQNVRHQTCRGES